MKQRKVFWVGVGMTLAMGVAHRAWRQDSRSPEGLQKAEALIAAIPAGTSSAPEEKPEEKANKKQLGTISGSLPRVNILARDLEQKTITDLRQRKAILDRVLEGGRWVERANLGNLSDEELEQLRLYLRETSAIELAIVRKILDQAKERVSL